jgi:hypothetical protein
MKVPLTSVALSMLVVTAIIATIVLADQDEPQSGVVVGGAGPGAIAASSNDNNKTDVHATKKITLACISDESGSVCSNRTASLHSLNVGYIAGGVGSQAFLSFNTSGIPDGAVIKKVAVDMRRCDVLGDPFLNLACMKAYPVFYDALSPEEYYTGVPLGDIMRICTAADLKSMQKTYPGLVNALQDSVGSERFQMRLQFERRQTFLVGKNENLFSGRESDIHDASSTGYTFVGGEWKPCDTDEPKPREVRSPNQKDLLRFGSVRLVVTYIPPEQEE